MDAHAVADDLEARLRAAGTAERADKERAYLKSDLEHLGVTVPAIRRITKETIGEQGPLDHDDLVALVTTLWERPVHERRMAGVELLEQHVDLLGPEDLPLLERLLRACRTWAFIDNLAANVIGPLAEADPDALDPVLRRWAIDEDFWLRRTSLLAHLIALRQGRGDWDRFAEFADAMLDEQEFFIRKAIGWILRDTAKTRPDLVTDWLEPRAGRAAGLTIREAVKHLPPEHRARIEAART
jgi:3-methyladenine DNA glycosylase AlkD